MHNNDYLILFFVVIIFLGCWYLYTKKENFALIQYGSDPQYSYYWYDHGPFSYLYSANWPRGEFTYGPWHHNPQYILQLKG